MLILIAYDVNTEDSEGKKRLRKVAKICVDYGQRVQNSVFECQMDYAKSKEVIHKLVKAINTKSDSLRIYYLGNNYSNKIEHYGAKKSYDGGGLLMV